MRYFDQFLAAAAIAAYAFAVMGPAGAVTGAAKGAGEVGKGVTGETARTFEKTLPLT